MRIQYIVTARKVTRNFSRNQGRGKRIRFRRLYREALSGGSEGGTPGEACPVATAVILLRRRRGVALVLDVPGPLPPVSGLRVWAEPEALLRRRFLDSGGPGEPEPDAALTVSLFDFNLVETRVVDVDPAAERFRRPLFREGEEDSSCRGCRCRRESPVSSEKIRASRRISIS